MATKDQMVLLLIDIRKHLLDLKEELPEEFINEELLTITNELLESEGIK